MSDPEEMEKLHTRVPASVMDELRGVYEAEVRGGRMGLTLRQLVEDSLRHTIKLAKRRGLKVRPVPRGALPTGRRPGR